MRRPIEKKTFAENFKGKITRWPTLILLLWEKITFFPEPILPNFVFLRFPIFAVKVECLLHIEKIH